MKRGLYFTNFVICIILLTSIHAQEQKVKTIKDYSPEDWKILETAQKIVAWKEATESDKQQFFDKNYPRLKLEGFTHESLSWADKNKVTNGKTSFDFDNPPLGVKKIIFDGTQFIYHFLNGEIAAEAGSIVSGENGRYQLISDTYKDSVLQLGEYGSVRVTEKGIFYKDATVEINGKTFSPNNPQEESFVRKVKENNFLTRNVKIDSESAIITTPHKDTDVYFDTIGHKGNQYTQIAGTNALMVGDDISLEVKKDFDGIRATGNNLRLIDGEVVFIFNGKDTELSRGGKEAVYDIEKIINGNDQDKFWIIEKTKDGGAMYITEGQRRVINGNVFLNYATDRETQESGLKLEGERTRAAILTGTSTIGVVDESNIPAGATREEYFRYLEGSRYKSLTAENTIDITDARYLDVMKQILGIDVNDKSSGLRGVFEQAKTLGIIDESKPFETFIDETILKASRRGIRFLNDVTEYAGYREPRAKRIEDMVRAVVGTSVSDASQVFSQFSKGLAEVHDTYGMIPNAGTLFKKGDGVRLSIELIGESAYGSIDPPRSVVKENGEERVIDMKTIRFAIDPSAANVIINQAYKDVRIQEALWKQWEQRQKKKK